MKMKKVVSLVCAVATVLSLNVVSVSAANIQDRDYKYTFGNTVLWHDTNHYNKTNTSKVYVKPATSPKGKTSVQTYCYVNGSKTNKTVNGTVVLADNTAYGITNYVYEHGDRTSTGQVEMWLKLKPTSGLGSTTGVWSPDWSGSGNVTIV